MPTAAQMLLRNAAELTDLLNRIDSLAQPSQQLAEAMLHCWKAGGKIMLAGNGGSAADAMHFAEELLIRFKKNRRPLAAIALCDPTILTCAGNDFGYDEVFARQVAGLGNSGDLLIVMSTSGNSRNLIRAVAEAERIGIKTVGFLGGDGGELRDRCSIELRVDSVLTHHVQEIHKVIYHSLCQFVDTQFD